ncbi:MAG: hypothetical protein ACFE8E_11845 [Candidatus Hodarchaeota archaeon]
MRGTYKSEVNIIISISGFWNDLNQIRELIDINCKYRLTENFLIHKKEDEEFIFHFDNQKSTTNSISTPSGLNLLKQDDKDNTDKQRSTVYLMINGGSIENAKKIMLAANCFLNIGGYEVKIETVGITHSKETWKKFIENDRLMDLIFAFVVTLRSDKENSYVTCGMHNLGHPDVIVPGYLDYDQANYLAKAFLYYIIKYNRVFCSGDKFRIDENSTNIYRITYEECHIYDNYDNLVYQLVHNPYGLWRLTETNLFF